MNSGKHLVILSPGFPKDAEDWYCIPPLQGFLEELTANYPDWKVTVVAVHYPYQKRRYVWKGISVIAVGGNNARFPRKLWVWQQAQNRLREIHQGNTITVLHSFWMQECAWMGQRFSQKTGVRHVNTLMGQDVQDTNHYLNRIPKEGMKVVAISERAAETYRANTGNAVSKVIPWGLDQLGQTVRHPNGPRKKWIVGVGNLVEVKRWEWFVEVISMLKNAGKIEGALLIGGGPQEQSLRGLAKQLNCEGFLNFSGHLDRPDILAQLGRHAVLLHTAVSEGQGYVFLEAQAQGLPIVSTPVGMAMPSERWKLGNSPAELAEACASFLESGNAFECRAQWIMKDTLDAYMEIYQAQG